MPDPQDVKRVLVPEIHRSTPYEFDVTAESINLTSYSSQVVIGTRDYTAVGGIQVASSPAFQPAPAQAWGEVEELGEKPEADQQIGDPDAGDPPA